MLRGGDEEPPLSRAGGCGLGFGGPIVVRGEALGLSWLGRHLVCDCVIARLKLNVVRTMYIDMYTHSYFFARWKTRSTRRTHTRTAPGATASAGGGLAHTHHPKRRLLNTTPCCACAASHIPCLMRCKALLQQQITIAATLLPITPHNTPASRASAFAKQAPALPSTSRHTALSDAPGRNALLFALLNAHHVAHHVVKLAAQRHLRMDHPPRHDFRARFRARVHHDHPTPRALCPLRPVRQQAVHNIHDLLLIVRNVSHRTRHLPACCAAARSSTSSSSAQLRERLHARR